MRKPFSSQELDFIKYNFSNKNHREIAKELGRPLSSIQEKCRDLGLYKNDMSDLTGQVFGRLTVLSRDEKGKIKAGYKYLCKCECGKINSIRGDSLKRGSVKSCGCYQAERASEANSKDDLEMLYNKLMASYKGNARRRDLNFELTKSEFISLVKQDCYYCGSEPKILQWKTVRSKEHVNGVDRIDSSKGYSLENCRSCCSTCNWMKNTMSSEDFLSHIFKISKFMGTDKKAQEYAKKSEDDMVFLVNEGQIHH